MANRRTRAFLLLVAVAAASSPPSALAQPAPPSAAPSAPTAEELATARQLFAAALEAEDKGRCADAIGIYERIAKIAVSPVLYFRLGTCHEALGHVVAAVNAFELAVQEADRKRDADVAKESKAHLEKLRPKTARLAIRVPADAEGVKITLDDRPVSAALAGATMVVDPGPRHVVVRAENYEKAFEADVPTAPGEAADVTADLGAKKAAALPPPLSASASVAPPPPAMAMASAVPPPALAPNRVPAYAVGGGALATGIVALATGLAAHAKFDEFLIENTSPKPHSFHARQDLHDAGQTLGLASTALTGVAVGGMAVALVLYLVPPASRPARASWRPWIGAGSGGLILEGPL
jgi:hypothetical protein